MAGTAGTGAPWLALVAWLGTSTKREREEDSARHASREAPVQDMLAPVIEPSANTSMERYRPETTHDVGNTQQKQSGAPGGGPAEVGSGKAIAAPSPWNHDNNAPPLTGASTGMPRKARVVRIVQPPEGGEAWIKTQDIRADVLYMFDKRSNSYVPVLPLPAVARDVNRSHRRILQIAHNGTENGAIRMVRFGNELGINPDEVRQYLAAHSKRGRPKKYNGPGDLVEVLASSEDAGRSRQERGPASVLPTLYTKDRLPVSPLPAVAAHVGLSAKRLFELARDGKVRSLKIGRDYFVNANDAQKYKDAPKSKGGRPRKRVAPSLEDSPGL